MRVAHLLIPAVRLCCHFPFVRLFYPPLQYLFPHQLASSFDFNIPSLSHCLRTSASFWYDVFFFFSFPPRPFVKARDAVPQETAVSWKPQKTLFLRKQIDNGDNAEKYAVQFISFFFFFFFLPFAFFQKHFLSFLVFLQENCERNEKNIGFVQTQWFRLIIRATAKNRMGDRRRKATKPSKEKTLELLRDNVVLVKFQSKRNFSDVRQYHSNLRSQHS